MDYMTPAQFEDEMRKLFVSDDPEKTVKAVDLMMEVLKSHGYSTGVDIYKKM